MKPLDFRSAPLLSSTVLPVLLLASSLGLLSCGSPGSGSGKAALGTDKPNIMLILFDDLNDWIEPLAGHPDIQTPNFQRLADMGVSFTNAQCDSTACNPSRTALLTGLRPSTTGVYKNGQPYLAAVADRPTMMEAFSAAGYRTLGAGKVFHSWGPGKLVWDEFVEKDDDPRAEMRETAGLTQLAHFTWGPLDVEDEAMDDVQVALQAKKWLDSPQKSPFFMALGFYRPHLPWNVPQKYFDLYPLDEVTIPKLVNTDVDDLPPSGKMRMDRRAHKAIALAGQYPQAIQAYMASVSFADAVLGRILDALEASPYRDNTIVVVTSDHGLHLGDKKHWGKYTLWERAAHVPLLVYAKGLAGEGQASPRPVTLVDLYPTLQELAGIEPTTNLDGISFAPLLQDPLAKRDRPALTNYPIEAYSIRDERWRYIRYRNGDEELYDHQTDRNERTNLAPDPAHDEVKERLAKAIPAVAAPNAPITFNPDDLQGTVKHLVRFYEPKRLIKALQPVAERREKRRQERKAAAAAAALDEAKETSSEGGNP
ncbi:MAG: sulfatase [Deltaproteobacteria bacterium]|nr:sulfatase [Deltaproteobacteria bacterium]